MERLGCSIQKTDDAVKAIAIVRKHFAGAVKQHTVLARAVEIGLDVLAADPALLVENEET